MDVPRRTVIVGAGVAGARCAETLRAEGFAGSLVVVGDEPHPPYERPSLSKELLSGARSPEELALRTPSQWAEAGIALLLGRRVVSIDPVRRHVVLADGATLDWDAVVLATGATARVPPTLGLPPGVHVLRTLADAIGLRDELVPGARMVIVGAGFVGAEVASTASSLGVDVVLLDKAAPFARVLGEEVSAVLCERYRSHGVVLRLGDGVRSFEVGRAGRVCSVLLDTGVRIPCDVALVAVGAVPAGRPLLGENDASAVETDELGRTRLPGVYACGDAARPFHVRLGRSLHVEHWCSAAGQGAAVARAILGRREPYVELPYFWSDQFGLRLQMVGHAEGWERVELEGGEASFVARYRDRNGRPLAALAVNRPREVGTLRRELDHGTLARAA